MTTYDIGTSHYTAVVADEMDLLGISAICGTAKWVCGDTAQAYKECGDMHAVTELCITLSKHAAVRV
jgi:hypothetical protein